MLRKVEKSRHRLHFPQRVSLSLHGSPSKITAFRITSPLILRKYGCKVSMSSSLFRSLFRYSQQYSGKFKNTLQQSPLFPRQHKTSILGMNFFPVRSFSFHCLTGSSGVHSEAGIDGSFCRHSRYTKRSSGINGLFHSALHTGTPYLGLSSTFVYEYQGQ